MREQTALLDHVSNAPAKIANRTRYDRFAVEFGRTRVGFNQTDYQSEQGRFSAITRSNENGGLATFAGEIYQMKRCCSRVVLAYIDKFDKSAHQDSRIL